MTRKLGGSVLRIDAPPLLRAAPGASLVLPLLLLSLAAPAEASAQAVEPVPVTSLPCEGCEAVFVGMPDSLSWRARIAPEGEPGEPMLVRGTVRDAGGAPAAGVVLYAYQTDARGVYRPDEALTGHARRHGELRAWVRTDEHGRYRFETIRPGGYPGRETPEHVHMHVVEPGCCTYWIASIRFRDDPRLPEDAEASPDARGGPGLVDPVRRDGVWIVERDVRLPARPER